MLRTTQAGVLWWCPLPEKVFGDEKVTDLLYKSFKERYDDRHPSFDKVRQRFCGIADELGVKTNIGKYLDEIEENIEKSQTSDYAASRGEYLMAILFADKLGWEFVDAAEMVKFDAKGRFDSESTNDFVSQRLKNADNAVISGFYGSMPDGSIKTFSRGGSDITGAIIARGVKADIYENWTDVNGFMTAVPKIVKSPKPIEILSYEELRELSYMGASVLHPESIFPLRGSNIPINIHNLLSRKQGHHYNGGLRLPPSQRQTGNRNRGQTRLYRHINQKIHDEQRAWFCQKNAERA